MDSLVDVRSIKKLASREFKRYDLTRQFILEESDYLTPEEFTIKCKVWLRLLTSESKA